LPGETWPDRTVKFIVPFGPGAGADIGARLFAERLSTRWGKPVVVENRPGGDGFVAITAFVGANDDHTLLFAAAGSFTAHPYQHDKVPYDIRDIVPIARVSNTIITVGVPAAMNFGSLADLVARAGAQPGKLNAALVPGITEFVWDGFVNEAKLDFAKVPYRDIVQAARSRRGRIRVMMTGLAVIRRWCRAACQTARRHQPQTCGLLSTFDVREAGFPALEVEVSGLFGPRSMAADLRDRIAADCAR
jgi:tripartite-type tricarboxylate transporter receptor subunit TctC